ncbi:hypothetical protein [Alkalimarinus sediminis]|uniref:Uncharacterized protein n=1 Tax=Alkalimarinus sediminis TaxID=1632866 RepID=A0A9E8HKW3_9ALTE|nr:hypothetical protein [Alkalimarinus sediminis]UZW76314.1 hypothetical protein NNL22_06945 [Alkalimarinus sediminis]
MEDWKVSIKQQLVTHSSGSTFKFNGRPGSTDYGISPSFAGSSLSALEQAQLIRGAAEAYQKTFKELLAALPEATFAD